MVTNLLHTYDAAGRNFIVIVGADDRENGWIGEALAEQAAVSKSAMARGLTQISTDLASVGERYGACRLQRFDVSTENHKGKEIFARRHIQHYIKNLGCRLTVK